MQDNYFCTSVFVNIDKHIRRHVDHEKTVATRHIPRSTNLRPNKVMLRAATLWVLILMLAACSGSTHLTFLNPQGPVADAQASHFFVVLGIMTVLVAGPVFILLPFIVWRYRYGNTASQYAPRWEFSRPLEIAIWGGPVAIVVVLATFVWRDTHKLDPFRPLASDQPPLRVQVIGYDWKWLFVYPEQGIASIGVLAMPVGRAVTLQITSATVMQSLFIPALGSQIYAMGGMVTQLNLEADKPGRYMGENTMYNGSGFHQQKFTALGMSSADFAGWIRMVRTHGTPLDAMTLQVISHQTTRSALINALPATGSPDGNLYFTDVSNALFQAVVMATMNGTAVPPQAFSQLTAPPHANVITAAATKQPP